VTLTTNIAPGPHARNTKNATALRAKGATQP